MALERQDNAVLLRGRDAREDVDLLNDPSQCGIGHPLQFTAQHNPARGESHLFTDMLRHQFIVTGHNLDMDAILFQRLQHLGHVCFGGIGKGQEAQQDQILLLRFPIGVEFRYRTIGDGEDPIPLRA